MVGSRNNELESATDPGAGSPAVAVRGDTGSDQRKPPSPEVCPELWLRPAPTSHGHCPDVTDVYGLLARWKRRLSGCQPRRTLERGAGGWSPGGIDVAAHREAGNLYTTILAETVGSDRGARPIPVPIDAHGAHWRVT